ncbi:MAG: 50S ribosomal protein L32 [Calditrichaeota bacterium]|nr:50S ribosomal protein L32 [Calditrichota bacterium]MCB9368305.1 50S ribosomal protein L32 [Calditrichota bacterium]
MPVPKRRTGKSRRDRRRANYNLSGPGLATCSNCKAVIAPHRVCGSCGYYNGRFVLQVKNS